MPEKVWYWGRGGSDLGQRRLSEPDPTGLPYGRAASSQGFVIRSHAFKLPAIFCFVLFLFLESVAVLTKGKYGLIVIYGRPRPLD